MSEESTNDTSDFVWTVEMSPGLGTEMLYVMRRESAEYWSKRAAVLDCGVWDDVADLGDEILEEVLGLAGYGSLDDYTRHLAITGAVPLPGVEVMAAADYDPDAWPPLPEDEFDPHSLPAVADGDWPPHIAWIVHEDLPAEIRDEFAECYETSFNGAYATIEPDKRDGVIAALEAAGFTVAEDPTIGLLAFVGW
jgi:hypothetical protein